MRNSDYCCAHNAALDDSRRFGTIAQANDAAKTAGRPRRPREIELIEQVAEEKREELRAVYADGLVAGRAVVVGTGPKARLEIVPDHPHRLNTAKEIMDRLHGKPAANGETHNGTTLVNINLITDDSLRESAERLREDLAASRTVESRGLGAGS
jgi:hypothetical protein